MASALTRLRAGFVDAESADFERPPLFAEAFPEDERAFLLAGFFGDFRTFFLATGNPS